MEYLPRYPFVTLGRCVPCGSHCDHSEVSACQNWVTCPLEKEGGEVGESWESLEEVVEEFALERIQRECMVGAKNGATSIWLGECEVLTRQSQGEEAEECQNWLHRCLGCFSGTQSWATSVSVEPWILRVKLMTRSRSRRAYQLYGEFRGSCSHRSNVFWMTMCGSSPVFI